MRREPPKITVQEMLSHRPERGRENYFLPQLILRFWSGSNQPNDCYNTRYLVVKYYDKILAC